MLTGFVGAALVVSPGVGCFSCGGLLGLSGTGLGCPLRCMYFSCSVFSYSRAVSADKGCLLSSAAIYLLRL